MPVASFDNNDGILELSLKGSDGDKLGEAGEAEVTDSFKVVGSSVAGDAPPLEALPFSCGGDAAAVGRRDFFADVFRSFFRGFVLSREDSKRK